MIRNYPPRACLACLGVAKRARAAVAVAAGGRRWPPVGGQPKLIEGMAYSLRTNNEKKYLGSCDYFFQNQQPRVLPRPPREHGGTAPRAWFARFGGRVVSDPHRS